MRTRLPGAGLAAAPSVALNLAIKSGEVVEFWSALAVRQSAGLYAREESNTKHTKVALCDRAAF
jgi:hypothetical protein